MREKEITLIDYINIIWKKKWIIIIGTIFCTLVVGIYSFMIAPVYEIDALIQPGRFMLEDEKGVLVREVFIKEAKEIAQEIKQHTYADSLSSKLGIDRGRIIKLNAEALKDTNLLRIWIRDQNVDLAKKILNSLIDEIKNEIDKKVEIEIKGIDSAIIERQNKIDSLTKMNVINNRRKQQISAEIENVKKNIRELEKERLSILQKKNRNEMENLTLLLYSSEVQQRLKYIELEENLRLCEIEIEENAFEIEDSKNKAEILMRRKGRIDYTKIIKAPTASLGPVSPNKRQNVLFAGIFGAIIFIVIAFFLDYVERNRNVLKK